MHYNSFIRVFLLGLCSSGCLPYVSACEHEPETPDWRMTLKTIRNGIHKIDTYLNAALDLFGGDDGLCHYRCSDGEQASLFLLSRPFSKCTLTHQTHMYQITMLAGIPVLFFAISSKNEISTDE